MRDLALVLIISRAFALDAHSAILIDAQSGDRTPDLIAVPTDWNEEADGPPSR
jgi:hypothetical protein